MTFQVQQKGRHCNWWQVESLLKFRKVIYQTGELRIALPALSFELVPLERAFGHSRFHHSFQLILTPTWRGLVVNLQFGAVNSSTLAITHITQWTKTLGTFFRMMKSKGFDWIGDDINLLSRLGVFLWIGVGIPGDSHWPHLRLPRPALNNSVHLIPLVSFAQPCAVSASQPRQQLVGQKSRVVYFGLNPLCFVPRCYGLLIHFPLVTNMAPNIVLWRQIS